jgi:hypothetical protein
MLKTKNLILLMAVIAIAVVFTAPAAMAVWPDAPSMFTPPPNSGTVGSAKDGYYEISASIVPDAECQPEIGDPFPCIKYQVFARQEGTVDSTSGIAAIIVTRPYDGSCTIPFEVVWAPDDLKFEPDEKALPNTPGWEWDSVGYPVEVGINSTDVTWGTVCLKINRTYYCSDMLVPTCEIPECEPPPAGGVAAAVQVCANNYGKKDVQGDEFHYIFFRSSDAQACIDNEEDFWICPGLCPRQIPSDPTIEGCTKLDDNPNQDTNHVIASGLQGQKCDNEAVIVSEGNSPFYYHKVDSGSYFWEGCYDYGLNPGGTAGWVAVCPNCRPCY